MSSCNQDEKASHAKMRPMHKVFSSLFSHPRMSSSRPCFCSKTVRTFLILCQQRELDYSKRFLVSSVSMLRRRKYKMRKKQSVRSSNPKSTVAIWMANFNDISRHSHNKSVHSATHVIALSPSVSTHSPTPKTMQHSVDSPSNLHGMTPSSHIIQLSHRRQIHSPNNSPTSPHTSNKLQNIP
jgi:hypothetical protein